MVYYKSKGIDWLERHYKDHRVHAINFPGDPYPIHIDATFTPIKEGLIINNKEDCQRSKKII